MAALRRVAVARTAGRRPRSMDCWSASDTLPSRCRQSLAGQMSLLNARAYKISGGRITLSHIPTISRGVRTQSNHVTTLTASNLRPELKCRESRSGRLAARLPMTPQCDQWNSWDTAALVPSPSERPGAPPNGKHDHRPSRQPRTAPERNWTVPSSTKDITEGISGEHHAKGIAESSA